MTNRRGFLYSVFASALGGPMSTRAVAARTRGGLPPFSDDNDPEFWDQIRDQFYIPRGEAFFNTGTIGSVPRPVLERVIEDMRTLEATVARWDYSEDTPNWISGYSPELPLRDKLGKLVNVEGKDIALTQNATFGSSFAANGLSLKPGDEVILTDREHPGAICAWQELAKKDRIVLKQVLIPTPANDPDQLVELFAGTVTSRTRVLAFPHIISSSAVVLPARRLTELAHQHGCLAIVDGAQALGQIPVDLQDMGCDAYFASPHKWLLAPPGNGMFYIRRDQREKFRTTLCSFAWDDQTDGMYRFMQYGTGNRSLLTGLDAALDFHFRIGPARIYKRMRFLADRLRTGLQQIPRARVGSPIHPELAAATVCHKVEGLPAAKLESELWTKKWIRVRSQGDQVGVRQSCQIYNSEAEIDATLEVVRSLTAHA